MFCWLMMFLFNWWVSGVVLTQLIKEAKERKNVKIFGTLVNVFARQKYCNKKDCTSIQNLFQVDNQDHKMMEKNLLFTNFEQH